MLCGLPHTPMMASAGKGTLRRWPLLLALLLAAAALAWAGTRWAAARATAETDRAADQSARAHAGLLSSELQKFRLLPLVLQDYPDVAAALAGGDAAAARRLDRTLELLQSRTDAAAVYVIARDGRTAAASNWRTPASFVGQDYGFRPYFRDAMRTGASELFALGTVSRRPGLYLARRVERGGRALGVVVVKVEFDRVEAAWVRDPGASVVVDRSGVILVTSVPGWRFRTTAGLDAAMLAAARRTLQFGASPPRPSPLRFAGRDAIGAYAHYRVGRAPAALASSTLIHLEPLAPALAVARAQMLLSGMGLLLAVVVAAALAMRSAEKRRLAIAARVELEAEVARRTVELRQANARLEIESKERAEADRRYRAAREELAQANRLGSIGQITAGVAHEIAQPVAAIRTFAENGATFLDRGAPDRARANLSHIVQLTERIGRITAELRAFARRRPPAHGATSGDATLGEAIDGTVLLLGERARGRLLVHVDEAQRAVRVTGDRIQMEQVLINLVQNALDAIGDSSGGGVTLTADIVPDRVRLRVADTGPGVDPVVADMLFTPFASAKPEGLGLGLAIARDIARASGGELRLLLGPPTTFELEMPRA